MTATSVVDAVRALVEPAVTASGLVLESVEVTPAGRRRVVRITVDLPEDQLGGVSSDAIAAASQAVSRLLDETDALGQAPYVLEVSSPGIDRPLTERRHWLRARRRTVTVALADGGTAEGRLTEVDDAGVVVGGSRYGWDAVVRGRMQVDFSRLEDDDLLDGAPGDDAGGESSEEG